MKKMFKVLLFPIWLVLEVVVFVLKLVMVLSSTVLGILLRILIPMAFVAMLLSVRNGLMLRCSSLTYFHALRSSRLA